MATVTVYFDCSDSGPTDPNGVWTNDSNAFNGSTSNNATVSYADNGSTSSNYLFGAGTNATDLGGIITLVRARVYAAGEDLGGIVNATIFTDGLAENLGTCTRSGTTTPSYGSYTTLSTPSGDWSWTKVQALEVKIFGTSMTNINDSLYAYVVELEVTYEFRSQITGISSMTGVSTITF